jgi:HD-GYP domain-containing protein (c-di-GMP phosphodiesterase class II)
MQRTPTVNLGNLVLSLSDAMDLANPVLIQHQQRVSFVAWKMAKTALLSDERIETIFITALLHDIGALSLEDKIALRLSETDNTEKHCIRGKILLDHVPWLKGSANIIRYHHTKWQDWHDSIENPIVFDAQILALADFLERSIDRDQYILHQHENIIEQIKAMAGTLFHPQIINLLLTICYREEFWLDLVSPRLYPILLMKALSEGEK